MNCLAQLAERNEAASSLRRCAPLRAAVCAVAVLAFIGTAMAAQARVLIKEVISREVSIHVGGVQTPGIKEIVSREASFFIENGTPDKEVVSREVSVAVGDSAAPPQVTGYIVTPSPTGDRVTLDWTSYNPWAVRDVHHFDIYISDSPFADVTGLTPAMTVSGETVTATVGGLVPFQDHFIAIVAVDALGNRNTTVINSAAYIISPQVISREISLFVGDDVPYTGLPLLSRGSEAQVLVPADGSLGNTWRQPSFTPTGWFTGNTGVGFGWQPGIAVRQVGQNTAIYGGMHHLATAEALLTAPANSDRIRETHFALLPTLNLLGDGEDGHYPNNSGLLLNDRSHYAVQATGFIRIPVAGDYTFGLNSDDGGQIKIDGAAVMTDDSNHGPQDHLGTVTLSEGLHSFEVIMWQGFGGSEVEFYAAAGALTSWSPEFALVGDVGSGGLEALAPLYRSADSQSLVQTNIEQQMRNVNASVYVRQEFNVTNPERIAYLCLKMTYADGFVAYLNGTEVARRNAPDDLTHNSSATAKRTPEEAVATETLDITAFTSLLVSGTNVLAIQGLNDAVDDGGFLILPEIFAAGFPAGRPGYRELVSREVSVAVASNTLPPQVTGYTVVASPTGDSATLDWTTYNPWAVKTVGHFDIYVSDSPFTDVTGMTPVKTVGGETVTATVTGLTPLRDHFIAIVAVDALGNRNTTVVNSGSYVLSPQVISREVSLFVGGEPEPPYKQLVSRECSILVSDNTVPAPVTGIGSGFTAAPSSKVFGAVDLDWTSYNESVQKDVMRYRVYVGTAFFDNVTGLPYEFVQAGQQRHTVTGLNGLGIYHFAVVAEDGLGNFDPAVRSFAAQVSNFGTNSSVDLDRNGFNTYQENLLRNLLSAIYYVGDEVNLNLGPIVGLPLPRRQEFVITGLPKGLTFNKLTGMISGTIQAENGNTSGTLSIKRAVPARSIPFNLNVLPYRLQGGYEVLIEDADGVPVGKSKLEVTGPGAWSATLNLRGQRMRSAKGTTTTAPMVVRFPRVPNAKPALALPETVLSFTIAPPTGAGASDLVGGSVTGGSFAGASLRGFRLVKAGRASKQSVTVALRAATAGNRTDTPGGSGYATGTGDGKGLLTVSGALGDAQAFSAGWNVSQTNQAVVFLQPYRDKATSFFGGIVTLGDLGVPERGGSSESAAPGLKWRKYDDLSNTELSYPDGFGLDEPLAVNGTVSVWHAPPNSEALALALGLNLREVYPVYTAVPGPLKPQTLPERLGLRSNFGLVHLGAPTAVPWQGSVVAKTGAFKGTLTISTSARSRAINGVLLEDIGIDAGLIGVGSIKIPVRGTGRPRGAYETAGIALRNGGAALAAPTSSGGFSEEQIEQIQALVVEPFGVGDTVDLDLGAIMGLPLPEGQEFGITGLPRGLTFDKLTGRISGTIQAENGNTSGTLSIKGALPARSIPFNLTVMPYRLTGGYEVLIEDADGVPVGKSRLEVTGPGAWSATLNLRGQRMRSAKGTTITVPMVARFPRVPNAKPALALPETVLSFTIAPPTGAEASDLVGGSVTGGSFAGASLRGFRLVKAGRASKQPVTVALQAATAGNRTDTPGGSGYATGTGDGKGLLTVSGALGDAQAFSAGWNVSQTNQAVVFLQPYRDKATSFFGGIVTLGGLGVPERGGSSESTAPGLKWRKYDDLSRRELSYPDGFGLDEPLAVNGTVSVWHAPPSSEALALALGLNLREVYPVYTAMPDLPTPRTLPERLGLRPNFGLVRLAAPTAVPWQGSVVAKTGAFKGTLTISASAQSRAINGVLLQDIGIDAGLIGVGSIKIPVRRTGRPRGSYETAGIALRNEASSAE